jgi:hypothetical protein
MMPGSLRAAAGLAVLGRERSALAEPGECRVRGIGDDEDITTPSAVAPVGTAIRDVLLPSKADCTPPA